MIAQIVVLRGQLGGIQFGRLLDGAIRISAASALLAAASYGVWRALDGVVGESTIGQIVSLGGGLAAGGALYLGAVLALRVPEARQLLRVVRPG